MSRGGTILNLPSCEHSLAVTGHVAWNKRQPDDGHSRSADKDWPFHKQGDVIVTPLGFEANLILGLANLFAYEVVYASGDDDPLPVGQMNLPVIDLDNLGRCLEWVVINLAKIVDTHDPEDLIQDQHHCRDNKLQRVSSHEA